MKITRKLRSVLRPRLKQVDSKLDQLILEMYCKQSPRLNRLAGGPLYNLRRVIRLQYQNYKEPIAVMKGIGAGTGLPLTIGCILKTEVMNIYRDLYYIPESVTVEDRGICKSGSERETALELAKEADLVIFVDSQFPRQAPPRGEWIRVRDSMRMVLDFPTRQNWDDFEQHLRYQKTNIKRVKRAAYTIQTSQSDEDFELFYSRMYVPTIQNRHKDHAILTGRHILYREFKRGTLIKVCDPDNQPVASKVVYLHGGVYFDLDYGIMDGRQDLLDQGALSAMYLYSLKWCLEHGIHRYDAGMVMAFPEDGVFIHKKRWGFGPILNPWGSQEWIFWVPDHSEAVLKTLELHPFLPGVVRVHGQNLRNIYTNLSA